MKIKFQQAYCFICMLFILATGLCLFGCASFNALPSQNGDDCLLLIPVEREEGTIITNEWGFKHTFYIQEIDKHIYVDPNRSFKMYTMQPGRYHVTEFRTIRIYNSRVEGEIALNIIVEMKPGEITIFPKKLVVAMYKEETEIYYYQSWRLGDVTISDKRNYIDQVREYKNYDQWEFSYFD